MAAPAPPQVSSILGIRCIYWVLRIRALGISMVKVEEGKRRAMANRELRDAEDLLRTGLQEITAIDWKKDHYIVPITLVASGIEKMLKQVLILRLWDDEEKLSRDHFKREYGHDLSKISRAAIPEKQGEQTMQLLEIMADFASGGRYRNLDFQLSGAERRNWRDDISRLERAIVEADSDDGNTHRDDFFQITNKWIVDTVTDMSKHATRIVEEFNHGHPPKGVVLPLRFDMTKPRGFYDEVDFMRAMLG